MEVLQHNTIKITFNGFTLRAKTWGNPDAKPMIALHGWLDNANTFDKIAPLLSSEYYLVAFDLAGHGLSDHRDTNASYYLWDYAIDILKALAQLRWKKVTMIAHSMGTGVAAIIAGAFPEMIEKLIFLDGLGAPFITEEAQEVSNFKKSFRQLAMAKKAKLYGFSDHETVEFQTEEEAIKDRMRPLFSSISYEAAAILVKRSLYKINGGYRRTYDPKIVLSQAYKMTEQQAQAFLQNIEAQTLLILGKQGLFADGMFASRIKKFKDAEVHWIDGGHHLHLEGAHHQISKLIHQFL